jgi:drug/metabolite transporter (DMT)-like permease
MPPHDPAAPAATPADPRRRVLFGVALLLVSALMFSLHNTLTRLAYDEGVAPTTVNAARTWTVLLLFVLAFGRTGAWPRVPRAAWLAFAITAVCYCLHNPLLLIAFKFVPVSLAVLVMYVFPLLVAFMAAGIGLERLRPSTLAAAAVAFAGVALVLEVGGAAYDWRGLALAAVSAVALAGNVVGAAQLNRHMKPLAVPFALSILGAVVFGALMLADGGPTLPSGARGWAIFMAATLTSPAALIAFYLALPLAGAPRSALLMNVEPIATVLLAAWLLGETLSVMQGFGAALIVGSIAVAALARLKARAR